MTNYEMLKTRGNASLDEMAVKMLLSRIDNDVDKRLFNTFRVHNSYFELYKSMKKWLESEVEE